MKTYALICSLVFAACNTTNPTSGVPIQPGTYAGTLSVTDNVGTDSAVTKQGQATFTFMQGGAYNCRGDYFLPGGGEYKLSGDSLYLTDTLARVAILDWTQVLDGPFYFIADGSKMTLTQNDTRMKRYRVIDLELK